MTVNNKTYCLLKIFIAHLLPILVTKAANVPDIIIFIALVFCLSSKELSVADMVPPSPFYLHCNSFRSIRLRLVQGHQQACRLWGYGPQSVSIRTSTLRPLLHTLFLPSALSGIRSTSYTESCCPPTALSLVNV